MSKVIAFLENMGRTRLPGQFDAASYEAAVEAAQVEDVARDALLARDADALSGLLGGRLEMMCLLFPAEGDENKDDGKESIRLHGSH